MTWQDPIVAEIRRIREQYAARFHHDIQAICRHAEEQQQKADREVVVRPPRHPEAKGSREETAGAPNTC